MKKTTLALLFITIICAVGCTGGRKDGQQSQSGNIMHHSTLLNIELRDQYTYVKFRNPWDTTKTLQNYVLIPKGKDVPHDLPEGTIVRTPIKNAVVYSAVHCALFEELGEQKSVSGVCDVEYIDLAFVKKGLKDGSIKNLGNSLQPNIEEIISLAPDAILLSPFENSGGYGALEKTGIPIIECDDYMETSPLGRAEWTVFFGLLTGKEEVAREIFRNVSERYRELAESVSSVKHRPTVMCDLQTGQTWYQPGGNSTIGQMYKDAGADYIFSANGNSGSISMSPEQVLTQCKEADFWLLKYNSDKDISYSDIKADKGIYAMFRPFKEKRIYGCNTKVNRYFEETTFHPERLLENLIGIFHPEIHGTGKYKYFKLVE